MKKIINKPENFVNEVMEGILAAYGEQVTVLDDEKRILIRADKPREPVVGVVTGGGSGHLPTFLGYVGHGMLHGCAVGNVFASPSANKMFGMIKACDSGKGVLCLYGNYGGDIMNFNMACEMADFEDIQTATVRVCDDVASSPKESISKRRGVAGMVYAFKIAGAASQEGRSLQEVVSVTEKALDGIRTMGVALSPCIVPEAGKPTFTIKDDEIEVGMGIHGEPGIEVRQMMTACEIANLVFDKILADMPISSRDEVSVMINGLGSTPLEEQLIVYGEIAKRLRSMGVKACIPHIGEYATSTEMTGLSITVFKLDDELKRLLYAPASTPFYTNSNKR